MTPVSAPKAPMVLRADANASVRRERGANASGTCPPFSADGAERCTVARVSRDAGTLARQGWRAGGETHPHDLAAVERGLLQVEVFVAIYTV